MYCIDASVFINAEIEGEKAISLDEQQLIRGAECVEAARPQGELLNL